MLWEAAHGHVYLDARFLFFIQMADDDDTCWAYLCLSCPIFHNGYDDEPPGFDFEYEGEGTSYGFCSFCSREDFFKKACGDANGHMCRGCHRAFRRDVLYINSCSFGRNDGWYCAKCRKDL